VLFAVWLRIAKGFFAARLLSIALIPATAWIAYRAGRALSARPAGLAFAGLVVLSPAYLRLAAISRGYSLMVLAICGVLAATANTERAPSRGIAVGLAALVSIWTSYLLWPLALAAPCLARLASRDRLRVTLALMLMMVTLAPRIGNALSVSATKTDVFELRTPAQVLGAAFATAGQAAPSALDDLRGLPLLGGSLVALLIIVAAVGLWCEHRRRLLTVVVMVLLITLPVLALLGSGRGIRERHVLGVQTVSALLVALGLGQMMSIKKRAPRAVGALLILLLVALCVRGNIELVRAARGWLGQLADLCSGADLLVIMPRSEQMTVYAMLTGDSPLAGEGIRWPPVCDSDTEWWCRRTDGIAIVSVDAIGPDLVASAAAAPKSIWIFPTGGEAGAQEIPPSIQSCEPVPADPVWRILRCFGPTLRRS
jgi:hypothetical protein